MNSIDASIENSVYAINEVKTGEVILNKKSSEIYEYEEINGNGGDDELNVGKDNQIRMQQYAVK